MHEKAPADFADYAARFPAPIRGVLGEMRETIASAMPQADETISYGLPAFSIDGRTVVWFAAFKNHIGFYPGAAAIEAFATDLAPYRTAKGSVQFPLDRPLPRSLITRMVAWKVREVPRSGAVADRGVI